MKIRMMVLSCLIGAVVLSMQYSRAEQKADKLSLKIGVVSIERIFQDCKRTIKYRQEVATERRSIEAKLEKLSKEIEAKEAGLETLKAGSSDYLAQVKEILQKRASLRVDTEFHNREMALKEQRTTEKLYGDILRETKEIAKQKGLDLVFEVSEPVLPVSSPTALELAMATHKLLYSAGCLDITNEVVSRLDAVE
jgi:Skp family chaperone for outer membrane proteins